MLPILKEGNKLVRISFSLFKRGLYHTEVVRKIKSDYNYDSCLVDASMIDFFAKQAKWGHDSYSLSGKKTLTYGSIKNWKKYIKGIITKEEFNSVRNTAPIFFIGKKDDICGNRKFKLDIVNRRVIFKQSKNNHHYLNIKTSSSRVKMLLQLQELSENNKIPITYKLSKDCIYVCFDESFLKVHPFNFIKNRISSIDLNPNYISLTIQDFVKNESRIIYRHTFDLSILNRTHNSNKITHELLQISKSIEQLLIHHKCEIMGIEHLTISPKNHKKGRYFNRLINNTWNRNALINNLKKRLNILGIKSQDIAPQYSSTIGCLMYPNETDSIAAALEIGRRTYIFLNRYIHKNKEFLDRDVVYPTLDYKTIRERWNSILGDYNPKRVGWVAIHNYLKEQKKLNYIRFLFKDYDFSSWSCFSHKSDKTLVVSSCL